MLVEFVQDLGFQKSENLGMMMDVFFDLEKKIKKKLTKGSFEVIDHLI